MDRTCLIISVWIHIFNHEFKSMYFSNHEPVLFLSPRDKRYRVGRTNGSVWVGNVPLNAVRGIPKCIGRQFVTSCGINVPQTAVSKGDNTRTCCALKTTFNAVMSASLTFHLIIGEKENKY